MDDDDQAAICDYDHELPPAPAQAPYPPPPPYYPENEHGQSSRWLGINPASIEDVATHDA